MSCQISLAINLSKHLCNFFLLTTLSWEIQGWGRQEGRICFSLWALVCCTHSASVPKAWERLGSVLQTWELAGRANERSYTVTRITLITPVMTDAITTAFYIKQWGAERSLLSKGISLQGWQVSHQPLLSAPAWSWHSPLQLLEEAWMGELSWRKHLAARGMVPTGFAYLNKEVNSQSVQVLLNEIRDQFPLVKVSKNTQNCLPAYRGTSPHVTIPMFSSSTVLKFMRAAAVQQVQ